jgi:hypothetical protein
VRHRLGVDFGTSNTVAMLRWPDGRVRPLLFDGSPMLPSAVVVDGQGSLLVGREAQHLARLRPEAYEPNPKRRIDDGTVLLGDRELSTVELFAAVLHRVVEEAERVAPGIEQATLTCPAAWGSRRRQVLLDAATRAELPQPRLVDEPVAAASYFARTTALPVGSSVVVYDFGAGTFDAGVVRRTPTGFAVLASEGLDDAGGLDVDAAIVSYLGGLYAGRAGGLWQRLAAPTSPIDRRANRLLWDDVRAAKETLSRTSTTLVPIPLLDEDAPLGREQLEQLAGSILHRTVEATGAALRTAGLTPHQVAGVFLVGGSSRIPLAATLLHRILGVAPTVIEQPELVVAEGSLESIAGATASPATPARGVATIPPSALETSGAAAPTSGDPAPDADSADGPLWPDSGMLVPPLPSPTVGTAPASGAAADPVSGAAAGPASGSVAGPVSPASGPLWPDSGPASGPLGVSGPFGASGPLGVSGPFGASGPVSPPSMAGPAASPVSPASGVPFPAPISGAPLPESPYPASAPPVSAPVSGSPPAASMPDISPEARQAAAFGTPATFGTPPSPAAATAGSAPNYRLLAQIGAAVAALIVAVLVLGSSAARYLFQLGVTGPLAYPAFALIPAAVVGLAAGDRSPGALLRRGAQLLAGYSVGFTATMWIAIPNEGTAFTVCATVSAALMVLAGAWFVALGIRRITRPGRKPSGWRTVALAGLAFALCQLHDVGVGTWIPHEVVGWTFYPGPFVSALGLYLAFLAGVACAVATGMVTASLVKPRPQRRAGPVTGIIALFGGLFVAYVGAVGLIYLADSNLIYEYDLAKLEGMNVYGAIAPAITWPGTAVIIVVVFVALTAAATVLGRRRRPAGVSPVQPIN